MTQPGSRYIPIAHTQINPLHLEEYFGPCIDAKYLDDEHLDPLSAQLLDNEGAQELRENLNRATSVSPLTLLLATSAVFLWIVDPNGNVLVGVEEIIPDAGKPGARYARLVGVVRSEGSLRLGHPAFVRRQSHQARFAGEIFWDREIARWVINNQSGRYGIRRGHTKEHLTRVASVFSGLGIDMIERFLE